MEESPLSMDSLGSETSHQPSILIVEDEEGPREAIRMVLSPFYNLYCVDSAEVGLQLIKEQPIDLVTLDLKLPGRQGLDLLQEIRREGRDIDVIIVTGYGTLQSAIEAIHHGVSAYILKPFNVTDLLEVIKKTLDRRHQFDSLRNALQALGSLWSTEKDPSTLTKNLGMLLEAKSPELARHAERVNYYASLLVEHLVLDPPTREAIQIGAFLHDIGKIGIQDRLSLGPTAVNDQITELMKVHPTIGDRMVQPLPFPQEVRQIIRHHHERYDGTGFPDQLKKEAIPYPARIVGLANYFDNLVTGQSEHGALAVPQARECVRREAGVGLDPRLAELFAKVVW